MELFNTSSDHTPLCGLALSGGGIRSATFGLGVLQSLARVRMLEKFRYLSTVSGGGYIGTWLSTLLYRNGNDINKMNEVLGSGHGGGQEAHAIQHLRGYGNFLTPEPGLLSADLWAALAIWMRNTLINLFIVLSGIVVLTVIPILFGVELMPIISPDGKIDSSHIHWLLMLVLGAFFAGDLLYRWLNGMPKIFGVLHWWYCSVMVLVPCIGLAGDRILFFRPFNHLLYWYWLVMFLLVLVGIFINLKEASTQDNTIQSESNVIALIIAPTVMMFILCTAWLMRLDESDMKSASPSVWAFSGIVLVVFAGVVFSFCRDQINRKNAGADPSGSVRILFSWLVSGAVGGVLLYGVTLVVRHMSSAMGHWLTLCLGPLLVMAAFFVTSNTLNALAGREIGIAQREWWGRFWGIVVAITLGGVLLSLIAVFGPALVNWMIDQLGTAVASAGGAAAFLASMVGIVLGKGRNSGEGQSSGKIVRLLVALVPWLVLATLFIGTAYVIHTAMVDDRAEIFKHRAGCTVDHPLPGTPVGDRIACASDACPCPAELKQYVRVNNHILSQFRSDTVSVILIVAAILFLLSLHVIDVNLFSLYHFYRVRLIRCYMGATTQSRTPFSFTDFTQKDEEHQGELIRMCHLKRSFLYPILNTTVNMMHGVNGGWKQRHGASFSFTPLYTGFELPQGNMPRGCYRPSDQYMTAPDPHKDHALLLSMAMTISGAAANPMMGYSSSALFSFILTLFNVRLGRWCPNPIKKKWEKDSPGGYYYLLELLGLADLTRSYLNLSDGGHFENLGVYELVRRRCRFILAVDGEEDGQYRFEALSFLTRKCLTDFGIPIVFDSEALTALRAVQPAPQTPQPPPASAVPEFPVSGSHFAIGRICYSKVDSQAADGVIVYLKTTLTGDEPVNIFHYKANNPAFPQQSTSDQWFDEEQFENYRTLGVHVADTVIDALGISEGSLPCVDTILESQEALCCPPVKTR
ncbi:MAG: patatin-like phospholipase family protein [Magnetococcales bacterium]|nr:patatin-like phospholipase family protein [Magnetococcales bacterium]